MSHRRILLIDTDPQFQQTLIDHLGPYGFEIVATGDGPDALAKVPKTAPEAVFIGVEEPDKVGYSLCNKAKKGVAKHLPVVLITSTVSPDGFANHRRLKVHADEYIDKRTMSPDELIGKMDNLIGLGELADADLSIPLEVEDMPLDLADDDMVVDEIEGDQLDLDDGLGDFADDEGARTALGAPQLVDALIEAETDAAFDAMTNVGDDPSVQVEAIEADEPGAEPLLSDIEDEVSEGIPEPIAQVTEAADETGGDADHLAGVVPEPIEHYAEPEVEVEAGPDLEVAAGPEVEVEVEAPAEPPPPMMLEEPDTIPPTPAGGDTIPPPVQARAGDAVFDLGLDEIAARANEEQSGVHDRRTLQRIHVLERENARLKAELEKARSEGGGKPGVARARVPQPARDDQRQGARDPRAPRRGRRARPPAARRAREAAPAPARQGRARRQEPRARAAAPRRRRAGRGGGERPQGSRAPGRRGRRAGWPGSRPG